MIALNVHIATLRFKGKARLGLLALRERSLLSFSFKGRICKESFSFKGEGSEPFQIINAPINNMF